MMMMTTTTMSMFLLLSVGTVQVHGQDSCTFDGVTYARGAALGRNVHESSCGPTTDYPCYCNPDAVDGIECPYCTAASDFDAFELAIGPPPVLPCWASNEVFRDAPLPDGTTGSCLCRPPIGVSFGQEPIFLDCTQSPEAPPNYIEIEGGECIIKVTPSSDPVRVVSGQPIPNLPSPCSNESDETPFPYICNPRFGDGDGDGIQDVTSAELPYCTFTTNTGDVVCAADETTVTFLNLESREMSCECSYGGLYGGKSANCQFTGGTGTDGDGTDGDDTSSASAAIPPMVIVFLSGIITLLSMN